jgi:hypothetical protein
MAKEKEMQQLSAGLSGKENIFISQSLERVLVALGTAKETLADKKLSFIRKNHSGGKVYFITNLQNTFTQDTILLHTSAQSVELYNPLTNERGFVNFKPAGNGAIELYLQLAPGQSCILTTYPTKQTGKAWPYHFVKETESILLQGACKLIFTKGEPTLPLVTSIKELTSWTTLADSISSYYSGTGVYTLQFSIPARIDVSKGFLLDLGDVREMAQITLNGIDLGKVWSLPFQVYIKPGLLKKQNTLEIAVTNLSANRIRYLDRQKVDWKRFHEINFVNIRYEPFDAAKWEPVESGLLGPVRLLPLK